MEDKKNEKNTNNDKPTIPPPPPVEGRLTDYTFKENDEKKKSRDT